VGERAPARHAYSVRGNVGLSGRRVKKRDSRRITVLVSEPVPILAKAYIGGGRPPRGKNLTRLRGDGQKKTIGGAPAYSSEYVGQTTFSSAKKRRYGAPVRALRSTRRAPLFRRPKKDDSGLWFVLCGAREEDHVFVGQKKTIRASGSCSAEYAKRTTFSSAKKRRSPWHLRKQDTRGLVTPSATAVGERAPARHAYWLRGNVGLSRRRVKKRDSRRIRVLGSEPVPILAKAYIGGGRPP